MGCKGSCFCGEVRYEFGEHYGIFQYCHCSRCRKSSGSAHAANIMAIAADFKWLSGEDMVRVFDPPETKYFRSAFCSNCGSASPWLSKNGKVMVVPAGGLDDDPEIRPQQSVFWGSRAPWYCSVDELPQHEQLPPRRAG